MRIRLVFLACVLLAGPSYASVLACATDYRKLLPNPIEYGSAEEHSKEALRASSSDAAVDYLLKLSASKLGWTLHQFTNNLGFRVFEPRVVTTLASRSPDALAAALRHLKEVQITSYEPEGTRAARVLKMVADGQGRQRTLEALDRAEPAYAANVRRQLAALVEGRAPEKTTVSDPALPAPATTKRAPLLLPADAKYKEALQHEYLYADANETRFIGTRSVTICQAITLYNPKTKTGLIAHFDPYVSVQESLDHVFADIRAHGLDPKAFEARIIGGIENKASSEDLARRIRRRFELEQIKIVELDVMKPQDPKKPLLETTGGLVMDLNTGHVFEDPRPQALTPEERARREKYLKEQGPVQPSPESLHPKPKPQGPG